ncbi:hypothetical protein Ancab_000621, partial [Ancistrocladus abbreviatus]
MADHRPQEGNPCLHTNANTVRNNGVSRIPVIASAIHDHQPPQRPHYSLIDVNFGKLLIIFHEDPPQVSLTIHSATTPNIAPPSPPFSGVSHSVFSFSGRPTMLTELCEDILCGFNGRCLATCLSS